MASVRKRNWKTPDGKEQEAWVVEYTDAEGKRRRKTPSSGLKKDADKLRQQIERELSEETHVAASQTMTFKDGADLWLKDSERRHSIGDLSGNGLASHKFHMSILLPLLGRKKLTEITADALQVTFDGLTKKYAAASLAGTRRVLVTFLAFMKKRKFIKQLPTANERIQLPKRKSTRPKIPTKEQIGALLRALEWREETENIHHFHVRRVVTTLALFCGMRRGEIAGLQWENVDFDNQRVMVRHSLSAYDGLKRPKSDAGERDIPMPPIVARALRILLSYRQLELRFKEDPRNHVYKQRIYRDEFITPPEPNPDMVPKGFVLITRLGNPVLVENLSKDFVDVVMRKAGWPAEARARLGMHSLRHAYVSMLIEQGLPTPNLTKLVGHANVSITHSVYSHLFPDDDRERRAIDGIADQFNATRTRQALLTH